MNQLYWLKASFSKVRPWNFNPQNSRIKEKNRDPLQADPYGVQPNTE